MKVLRNARHRAARAAKKKTYIKHLEMVEINSMLSLQIICMTNFSFEQKCFSATTEFVDNGNCNSLALDMLVIYY